MFDLQIAAALPPVEPSELSNIIEKAAQTGCSGLQLAESSLRTETARSRVRELCYQHQIALISAVMNDLADNEGSPDAYTSYIETLDGLGAEYLLLPEKVDITPSMLEEVAVLCETTGLKASMIMSEERVKSPAVQSTRIGIAVRLSSEGEKDRAYRKILSWGNQCDYIIAPIGMESWVDLETLSEALSQISFTGWLAFTGLEIHSNTEIITTVEACKAALTL